MAERKFWQFPWEYRESFFIAGELFILGVLLDVLTKGKGISPPTFPTNFLILITFLLLLVSSFIILRKHPFVQWISGIPAAISSISLFGIATLLTGLLPQQDVSASGIIHLLGFDHFKYSWLMVVSQFYFLTCLGFVTLRRCNSLSNRNLGFMLNHIGLGIAISAASLGTGDLLRLAIVVKEGEAFTSHAYNQDMQGVVLPFEIRLTDFAIKEYNPKLVLFDNYTQTIVEDKDNNPDLVFPGLKINWLEWSIRVDSLVSPVIYKDSSSFIIFDTVGSVFAAKIEAKNIISGQSQTAWVSNSSITQSYHALKLSDEFSVGLTIPEPKIFSSAVELKTESAQISALIEVNKPFKIKGWKLYQKSYDINKGKWSELSVLEAVKDPWLPAVYTGLFLMMAGAVFLFVTGRPKNIK